MVPEEPDPKVASTWEVAASEMEDSVSTQRHTIGMPGGHAVVTVSQGHLHLAGREPNRGLPAYAVVCPMSDTARFARDPIFIAESYQYLDADHGLVTGDPMEPLTRALTVA